MILALALTISAPVVAQNKDLRVLDAVKRRDQKTFTSLIRAKADLNAAQPDGATALAWAVHLGQRSMAEALLDAGANANTVDEYGETPLTLAAANGDGALVQRLLKAGAKATIHAMERRDRADDCGRRRKRRRSTASGVHGADVNAADPRRGQTALMWAAAEGHSDVVSALLEIGANPKAASKTGFNALVFAVTKDNVDAIDKLIAAGADPNYTLPSGNKPLLIAMAYRHTDATLALLERGADIPRAIGRATRRSISRPGGQCGSRQGAARQGRGCECADAAIDNGGRQAEEAAVERFPWRSQRRTDAPDDGRARRSSETMRALVAGGADPLIRAQDGTNLLMAAASGGRLATVKYAYELDPYVDVVTAGTGNTIMHVSVGLAGRTQPEVVEVMQFLADRGAKLDEMNAANRTPISLADGQPVDLAVDLLTKLITESGSKPKIPSKR